MKIIPTKIHGFVDYAVGMLLFTAPWLFNFGTGGPKTWVMVALGFVSILYSFITAYEMGISPKISMRTHLILDVFTGVALITAPFLLGFSKEVFLPYVLFGSFAIIFAGLTKVHPASLSATGDVTPASFSH